MSPQVLEKVDEIVAKYNADTSMLIAMLQDIQRECQYLPRDVLLRLQGQLGVPLPRIYAVATFYKTFSLQPRGKHLVQVCLGTACHVRGGKTILKLVKQHLGIDEGQTTSDLEYTLETVACIGVCALAPNMVVSDRVHGHMNPKRVEQLFKRGGE